MSNAAKKPEMVIRDVKTGRSVIVRGVGALKDSTLVLREGIDLTKPIAAQLNKNKPNA